MCLELMQARTRASEFIKSNDGLKGDRVRVIQILGRNFFFLTTFVSSNDYRSEKIRRRAASLLHMLTTSRGDHVCASQITSVMPSSVRSYGQQPAGTSVHEILQA